MHISAGCDSSPAAVHPSAGILDECPPPIAPTSVTATTTRASPPVDFEIAFQGGDKNSYDFVSFYKAPLTDPNNQLSGVMSADRKSITVTDQCSEPSSDMVYGAVVMPVNTTNVTFICHPVISNKQLLE
jgi:hypothetical protein